MNQAVRNLLAIWAFCLHAGLPAAEETTPPPAAQRSIPYKTEPTPVEEQGVRTAFVLIGLLLATGLGLYAVRKRMPRIAGLDTAGSRMRIVGRSRLNPRCTLYLIRLDQRELLIAQCGDHLVQLDPNQATQSPATASEAEHG